MRKKTKDNLKEIDEKLKYIGLDLNNIPEFLYNYEPLKYKPPRGYNVSEYIVYKYINISDIQILITPTDRLEDVTKKYDLASPLFTYFEQKDEEDIEKYNTFLNMIKLLSLEKLKEVEKEQEILNKKIPYQLSYKNNYIWQIYYSDITNKYFMLASTKEMNNTGLFYLLKKQIENRNSRKKEYIYAPISYAEYSGQYLSKSQISDLENYLWYFTKDWPKVYELYDKKGGLKLKIIGYTNVYEKVKSIYSLEFKNRENALEFYKLLKALFILSTGLPEDYNFSTKISDKGLIEFYFGEKKIEYLNLSKFINEQVFNKHDEINKRKIDLVELKNKIKDLKETSEKQTEEYLLKQKQIATFLECKKTFLGKLKYYFGSRKSKNKPEVFKVKPKEEKKEEKVEKEEEQIVKKEQYTIEDLIEICGKLDKENQEIKNLKLDIKALELKVVNMKSKIKNANIYINEIEMHKRSIFEFWKFSNKDELPSLNEGEEEEEKHKEKIGKTFSFEEDIEDLGQKMDEIQRRKLSKNETDAIFSAKQVLETIKVLNEKNSNDLSKEDLAIIEKQFNKLEHDYENNIEVINVKDFDIFGGMSEDKTKIKEINNKKHREVEKDKYKILNITPNTELSIYIDNLRNYINLIKESLQKISTHIEIPVYLVENKEIDLKGIDIFNINPKDEIYSKIKQNEGTKNVFLYKINMKENSSMIFFTNIMFYDNFNKTLPMGMDLSSNVLLDLSKFELNANTEGAFNVNYLEDEFTNKVIKVNYNEYEINEITKE